jgi:hypothetical protein
MWVSRKQYILIYSSYRSAPSLPPATTTAACRYHPRYIVIISVLIIVLCHCCVVVSSHVIVALLLLHRPRCGRCCVVDVLLLMCHCRGKRQGGHLRVERGVHRVSCAPSMLATRKGGRFPGRDHPQVGGGFLLRLVQKGRAAGIVRLVNRGGYLQMEGDRTVSLC